MRVAVDDIKEKVRRIVMFLTVESLRKEKWIDNTASCFSRSFKFYSVSIRFVIAVCFKWRWIAAVCIVSLHVPPTELSQTATLLHKAKRLNVHLMNYVPFININGKHYFISKANGTKSNWFFFMILSARPLSFQLVLSVNTNCSKFNLIEITNRSEVIKSLGGWSVINSISSRQQC